MIIIIWILILIESFCFFFLGKMEKNVSFAANDQPTAPLPTAPPSYEEAIANTGAPTHPPVIAMPYPQGNAPIQMPMPCMISRYMKQI